MSESHALDRPVELAALVDYQEGSIVSRTLVKEPTGSVTLFAFDAGEELSEHQAPFAALLAVVDGVAAVRVGATEHAVTAGQILHLPAQVPHAVRADERFKMLLVMIRNR